MYKKRRIGILVIIVLLIGFVISYKIYASIYFSNTAFESNTYQIIIPTGTTEKQLHRILAPALKNEKTFFIIAEQKGYLDRIKPGLYTLTKGMSNNEIINKLRLKGEVFNLTFNNADSLEILASKVSSQIEADSISLVKSFKNSQFLKDNHFSVDTALSMYIPNTYQFYWDTTADEFRDRMLREYHSFWNSNRIAKAKKNNLTPLQVYSLASIVHKESVKEDERPRIAGVYLNRLQRNMKLQADPTVIYALKRLTGDFDQVIRRVLYKDLKLDSPYNTYKYKGVPPGPIAMPDFSAIEAVLNPEKHDYLFFVADVTNYGYHKFASTLRQHNNNRKEYVEWINEQKINR